MTAYSNRTYAEREANRGAQIPLVSIRHGDPLNNPHRAPFLSGASAARALHHHAMTQLGNPETGPEFFQHLTREFRDAALDQRALDKRLQTRSRRAARALATSDIELSLPQLQLSAEIADVQARIAERLIPNLAADGAESETVIDLVDTYSRRALASSVAMHEQRLNGEPERAVNNWQEELAAALARSRALEGRDNDEARAADAELLDTFITSIDRLEQTLPDAVDRPDPLYEIDEIPLDPDLVQETSERLARALDSDTLGVGSDDEPLSIEDRARQAIWRTMSKAEREAYATKIFLSPQDKINHGLSIINSTPPMIKLPEADLTVGRFDVRMASVEEATVMEGLLRWAGEQKVYPGPEASLDALRAMGSNSAQAGYLGPQTFAITVNNDEASIERVRALVAGLPADARILLHSINPETARSIMEARTAVLAAAGIDRPIIEGAADATDAFGGVSLLGDNDRILGDGPRDHDILVANADSVIAYVNRPSGEITPEGRLKRNLAQAEEAVAQACLVIENETTEIAALAGPDNNEDVAKLLGLVGKAGMTPKAFTQMVETSVGIAISKDLVARAKESVDLTPRALTSAIEAVTSNGKLKPEIAAKLPLLQRRRQVMSEALRTQNQLQGRLKRAQSENLSIERSAQFQRAGALAVSQARIVSEAARQGKLQTVTIPAAAGDRNVIKTEKGNLVRQNSYEAVRAANLLLEGADFDAKRIRDALSSGIGRRYEGRDAFTVTLAATSNVMYGKDKAAQGLEEFKSRLSLIPENGAVLIDNNTRNGNFNGNPGTNAVLEWAKTNERPVIYATAWRVTDRVQNFSERETRLDLGFAEGSAVPRDLVPQDVSRAVIVVTGGGHMDGATWDALQQDRIARRRAALDAGDNGKLGDQAGLFPHHAEMYVREINDRTGHNYRLPDVAETQKARAIMQEAMVDFADNAMIATDLGRDYHSANLIRLAAETNKLGSVIGPKGDTLRIDHAYDHSLQFAHSMSERTLGDIQKQLSDRADSNFGQLVLTNLPGVNAAQAARMMDSFETLNDIHAAAASHDIHPAIPNHLKEELAIALNWGNAIKAADEIKNYTIDAGMRGMTAADHAYPAHLTDRGHSPILYTLNATPENEGALTSKKIALVTGERSDATETDLASIRTVARDAATSDHAVALHLNGALAAKAALAISEMPDAERPRLLLVGDGHPASYHDNATTDAIFSALHKGALFVTPTPPTPTDRATQDEIENGTFPMKADRQAAANMLGQIADGVVIAKANSRDPALQSLRTALNHNVPVAIIGGALSEDGKVTSLDWGRADYAANRKLLHGNAHFEIETNVRPLAFSPNSIPSIDTGSGPDASAFKRMDEERFGQSREDRPTREELDPHSNKIESERARTAAIDTTRPAFVIGTRQSAADFIEAIENGNVPPIKATELDLAARQKEMDDRILHTSSRDTASAEIRAEFSEISEAAHESVQRYDTYKTAGAGAGYTHLSPDQAASAGVSQTSSDAAEIAAMHKARAASLGR